jgi:hypothetical protein
LIMWLLVIPLLICGFGFIVVPFAVLLVLFVVTTHGLPLRLGGCGLPIPSPTLSAAARLSSVALKQAALRQGPAIFRPFDGPHCAILQQTWETLKTTAADLCSPETATLQAALEHGTLAQAQHSFGHHEAQRAYEALHRTADGFSPTTRMLVLSRPRSVACRAASAWLETLPTAPPLRLDDGAFRAALRRRLGECNLPSGSPDATCFCRTSLRATDAEHALTCRSPNALRVLRHDDIVDVVRSMLRRGGVPSTKEPRLPVLHLQGPSSARPPAGARGNLLFSLEGEQWVGDVSIIHPGAATYRAAAAQTDGSAAARRDVEKTSHYRRYGAGCYHVVPLTVETYGRLGKPLMKLITDVGASAAQQGDDTFTRDQFITGVLRELSVCLCRRNANIECAVSGCFVRVSGGAYMPGLVQPTADVE